MFLIGTGGVGPLDGSALHQLAIFTFVLAMIMFVVAAIRHRLGTKDSPHFYCGASILFLTAVLVWSNT